MIRGMDGWIGCGSDRVDPPASPAPSEFLPLSDSSYAENDFTPSDNIVVVVPRSRITFVAAADKFSRNVRQGGGRRALRFLPLTDDGLLTFLANKMPQAERKCKKCIFISTGLKFIYCPIK